MGRRPIYRGRNVDGIILLDKPEGLSSNDVLQKVKYLFRANRAGHTGVLDTLATGMLPICLGEATKFSQHIINSNKRYRVTAKLGERTNTYDATGHIMMSRTVVINKDILQTTLNKVKGLTHQIPPMFSNIKYQGRPLYEYARKGIEVIRKCRPINIYDINLIFWDKTSIVLEVHCSKGTYIRTIIDDIGEFLGCGAHVTQLRRLAVANYQEENMVTLTSLQDTLLQEKYPDNLSKLDSLLLSIDKALSIFPAIHLPISSANILQLGNTIAVDKCLQLGLVRMFIANGNIKSFFGIGEITTLGLLKPRRLISNVYHC
ncbi:tRNA pseudouridine(55) synthase TruB [Candidatus Palibaumannia cicadellinicola]|uniref:tRNA pseudouridine synthase B n=1 Tax=Candidatus Palibaumannia cicadellinicola TaxID=186490 RepID=A0A0K2BL89_9GAMM|nr:tRNA pseudouridine(55) synthase TruB [Candidatus Baumannia cicadellinicola]AKZ66151.1 tRNA pseudouridine synthase B [Candidatus Baumannia cicadellinicola]